MNDTVKSLIQSLELDEQRFTQKDVVRRIADPFGSVWTTVYDTTGETNNSIHTFCCLADAKLEKEIISGQDWLKHAGEFKPCIWQSSDETWYSNGQDDGYEYLIASQYFHALDEEQLLLNPEFIFLLQLYKDKDGDYYLIDQCGNKTKAVEFSAGCVKVRTKCLMQYISAKQMLFVQFIDSRVSTPGEYPHNAVSLGLETIIDDRYSYFISYSTDVVHDYLFSMIYARSVVEPQPIDKCGIWPYEEEEAYPEFIVKELPDGTYERFTCDPSKLANYFGANPDAPHYLTPVYFKPSVLDRYRKNPLFDISERRLACGSKWSTEIDNVDPSRVMLFLGDLGRDVPSSERAHFLEHEMSPTGQSISTDTLESSIFGMWVTNPSGPIARFFLSYNRMKQAWHSRFGWELFRAFHPEDENIERMIRIPTTDNPEEFETVMLNLSRMLVDYIDESRFKEFDEKGSINKISLFLLDEGIDIDLTPLRNLYSLRSDSIAHSKGKNYEKLKRKLNLTGDAVNDATLLIGILTDFMDDMTSKLDGTCD